MGTTFQGKYSDSIKGAYVYPSSNFLDDLTWAAAWLYRKTGEQQFLQVICALIFYILQASPIHNGWVCSLSCSLASPAVP